MSELPFFDSLVHANRSGDWLGNDRYDGSISRLLQEIDAIATPYRACLVNIAGFSDNDELAGIAAEHPDLFVPIAGFDPSEHTDDARIKREIASLARKGFAGIKLHPRLNGYDPLDERVIRAIREAGRAGLVVFLCTYFRQLSHTVRSTADIVDKIAFACPESKIVLLHGGASAMLDLYEIVRMRSNLLLDLSFTLLRYQGSSLDADMKFVLRTLDQRTTVGTDFPEFSPHAAARRISELADGIPQDKQANFWHRNLERFLDAWLTRNA